MASHAQFAHLLLSFCVAGIGRGVHALPRLSSRLSREGLHTMKPIAKQHWELCIILPGLAVALPGLDYQNAIQAIFPVQLRVIMPNVGTCRAPMLVSGRS